MNARRNLVWAVAAPPVGILVLFFVVFFFQAEDGIRDSSVTGVQTCALPISLRSNAACDHTGRGCARGVGTQSASASRHARSSIHTDKRRAMRERIPASASEIGRASCRERV